jgi:hypothetical protein
MLTRAADDLFDRVARETAHEVQRIVTPGEALIDVLAQTRLGTAGTLAERLDTLALLREGFAVSAHISAIYAGYANGDLFLVRRVPDAAAARKQLGAPDRAAYLVQSIERRASGGEASTFVWLDAGLERIAAENRPEYAAFDPRERPWYRAASAATGQIKTAPYVFFTTNEVGVTLARSAAGSKAVVGADITLREVSGALARQRITPGTEIALANPGGRVIGYPDAGRVLRAGRAVEDAHSQ